MAPIDVLHILDHSVPIQDGYSYRTLGIIKAQRAIGLKTAQLTTPRHNVDGPNPETVDSIAFYRSKGNAGSSIRIPMLREIREIRHTERALVAMCGEMHPNLLQAHSPILAAIPALRVAGRLKLPLVYEVRAFWEDAAVSDGACAARSPRYITTRWMETQVLRRVQAIVVICKGLRDEIISRGIAPSKISVIPNAIDPDRFTVTRRRDPGLAAKLGMTAGPVLGFIGSFYRYEGLTVLLDALPTIRKAHPDVRVLLVGGGQDEAAIRKRAAELGIREAVIMTGRVPNHDVPSYYSLIDISVYPRLKDRLTDLVTPLKPLESMAQRRIVVASDVGGHRELIVDRKSGFLFPAGDAQALAATIIELINRRDEWPRVLECARSYIEAERTWPIVISQYRKLYADLLNPRIY